MSNDTHTTGSNGHLLEAIWELNDRFNAGDDEALDQQFKAVAHYRRLAAENERAKIVAWLRHNLDEWPDYVAPSDIAAAIEAKEHLK